MIRLLIALLPLLAIAPSRAAASRLPSAPPPDAASMTLDQLIARRLVQHSARFARPGPPEDPLAGYRAAVGILSWAGRLAPEDVDIPRRIASAAGVLDASMPAIAAAERDLLRLDPDSATAQLRVIDRAIDERQSAADRISTCERLLRSPAGSRLAPEVLSHIAYRASVLSAEQGRASVASSYLDEALRHNPANIDAAALNALETDRQTAKIELLVRAMVTLVKADPANKPALSDLIAVVQESGDCRDAAALIEAMSALVARQGESISDDLFAEYALLRSVDAGPREGLDLINQRQESFNRFERQRLQAQWLRDQQNAAGGAANLTADEVPTFEDVSVELSGHLQLTRAMLAAACDAEPEVAAALAALEAQWTEALADLAPEDPLALSPSAAQAVAAGRRDIIADRAWTRLWLGRDVEAAAEDVMQVEQSRGADRAEVQRLRGWLKLRQGDADGALTEFAALQARDPLSDLGLALAQIELGRTADAGRLLGEIYQAQPGKLVGILSKWRYEQIAGRSAPAPRATRAVEKELDRFPELLGDLLLRPQRYLSLSIAAQRSRIEPLDPMVFEVTVRNDGPWALAIGPDRFLSSRLALFPIFRMSGQRVSTGTPPLAIDLQRRLVLPPGAQITVPVSIDHTLFGLIIPSLAANPVTIEFQAMLDYGVGPDGGFRPRAWSLVRQSGMLQVAPWSGLRGEAPADFTNDFTASDGYAAIQAVSRLGAVLHARLTQSLDPAAAPALTAASDAAMARLIEVWPQLDPHVAAWAVLSLPFQSAATETPIAALEQFEATARRSTDPLIQLAWIVARASAADDPVIAAAVQSESPDLRRIAEDARAYLAKPAPSEPLPAPQQPPVK